MIAAKTEAKRFVRWLEKYSHHEEYSNLGEALLSWCTADDGATRLGYDYAKFLQMVIAVITSSNSPLKVGLDVGEGKYTEVLLPTTFDGWLPDREDFEIAVGEVKRRHAERNE